jgi:[ribosomal protein S18]-alanine N-acetyltransferase
VWPADLTSAMAAAPEKVTLRLRKMQEADLREISVIEESAFPDPWPESSFRDCLRLGYVCRVLEHHFMIQAYGIIAIETATAHILNLCVRAESRRRGWGHAMLNHLLDLARAHRVNIVFLEVRSSNLPAIKLYHSMGFTRVGIRENYYPNPGAGEDAVVMALNL